MCFYCNIAYVHLCVRMRLSSPTGRDNSVHVEERSMNFIIIIISFLFFLTKVKRDVFEKKRMKYYFFCITRLNN